MQALVFIYIGIYAQQASLFSRCGAIYRCHIFSVSAPAALTAGLTLVPKKNGSPRFKAQVHKYHFLFILLFILSRPRCFLAVKHLSLSFF